MKDCDEGCFEVCDEGCFEVCDEGGCDENGDENGDEGLMIQRDLRALLTDRQMDKQKDIGDCRDDFVTEKQNMFLLVTDREELIQIVHIYLLGL